MQPVSTIASKPAPAFGKGWLLLLCLAPVLLWNCFNAPFLPVDDGAISMEPIFRDPHPWATAWQFRDKMGFYYPLTLTSYLLDQRITLWVLKLFYAAADLPAAIRSTNFLLHAASSILVWRIFGALGWRGFAATLSLAIFALHPLACESVCWCIERKNALAACLALASLLCYFSGRGWQALAGAVLCYALALLAKPSALGVLAILFCWEALGRPGDAGNAAHTKNPFAFTARPWPGILARMLPFALLAAAGVWVGVRGLAANLMPPPGGNIFTALLTDVPIIWRYVTNLLLATPLSFYYAVEPVSSLADGRLWSCGAALLALSGLLYWGAAPEKRVHVLFGALWFIGALGPNLNLVGLNDLMHDRFIYLSTPGFLLMLTPSLERLVCRSSAPWRFGTSTLCGVALLLTVFTYHRSTLYGDAELLLRDAAIREPESSYAWIFTAHVTSGKAMDVLIAGKPQESAKLWADARREMRWGMSRRDYARFHQPTLVHALLSRACLNSGYLEEARQAAEWVLHPPPPLYAPPADRSVAYVTLAQLELRKPDPPAALEQIKNALLENNGNDYAKVVRCQILLLIQHAMEHAGNGFESWRAYREALATLSDIAPDSLDYPLGRNLKLQLKPPALPETIQP